MEHTPIDPPRTLAGRLREIGPGIIVSGAIVGSGELIVTTKLGAEAGFVLLWLILFSCVIKVFLQIGDHKTASKFFQKAFSMRRLTVLDEDMNEMFEREMRIYLLKTEEEFSQLAVQKYTDEIKAKNREERERRKQKKSTTDGAQSSTKEQTGESFPKNINLAPTQNKSMHQ